MERAINTCMARLLMKTWFIEAAEFDQFPI